MRINNLRESINIIDNKAGLGNVPYNSEVDYRGLRVKMKPSMFLKLAAPIGTPISVDYIETHLEDGGKIGAPFLILTMPTEWQDEDFSEMAKVRSHEGRNRMIAVRNIYGDVPIETHLFFSYGVRNRDLTPHIINELNKKINSETGITVTGPIFEL